MDRIQIKGLRLFAYHGVGAEEKRDGQNFVLDITLGVDLDKAGRSDDLNETVNYAEVCRTVREVFTKESYDLIERAARQVTDAILENYPKVEEVTVLLKKPEAPIPEKFDYVAVEMTQRRKEENPCR